MLGSRAVAIELGRKRLCALLASARRHGVVVRKALVEPIPSSHSRHEAEAFGQWLSATLRKAGMSASRAVVVLSRDEVILKRLTLPTTAEAELPDMTRLAMTRDLPFDASQAVIDFVPLERTATSTTVLALAMPRPELESALCVMKAAGLDVSRVSLRAMGAAELVASVPGLKREPSLLIDITGERIEFSVVRDGAIRFARAADLPIGAPEEHITEAIITETRRTWLSYRIGDDTDGVRQVILMGDEQLADLTAEAIAGVLNLTPTVLHSHPNVDRGHLRLGVVWPLAGLLLEHRRGDAVIDMAHPRKPPDVHARLRVRILAAAALLIMVCGLAFTLMRSSLSSLEREEATLAQQNATAVKDHARFKRDTLKLEHLKQWETVSVDWLDHLDHLVQLMPGGGDVVLSDLTGTLDFRGVKFDSKAKDGAPKWAAPSSVRIDLKGEAKDRLVADTFRAAILKGSRFSVNTSGVEREGGSILGFPFNYKLLVIERGEELPAEQQGSNATQADAEPSGGEAERLVMQNGNQP